MTRDTYAASGRALIAARDEDIATHWIASQNSTEVNRRIAAEARRRFAIAVVEHLAERPALIWGRPAKELRAAMRDDDFGPDGRPTTLTALAALRQTIAIGRELATRIEKEGIW